MKLNLGCGKDIRPGWVNIDRRPGPGVDLVLDIAIPLPYAPESVEYILCSHVLEHLPYWEDVMPGFYGLLKPGGILEIRVPYMLQPQAYHYRCFYEYTMDIFVRGSRFYESDHQGTIELVHRIVC